MSRSNPMRDALLAAHQDLTRRSFFNRVVKAAGIAAVCDRFGESLFAQTGATPLQIFSGIGKVIIPIDEDPGWANFDPGISDYALNKFTLHVVLGGSDFFLGGVNAALLAFNSLPVSIGYSPRAFVDMEAPVQSQYFSDIFTGQFENYGTQDLMFLAAFTALFSVRATFFSNYPNHLANPQAEFQIIPAGAIKTGWQIMGYKGPVGPEEEQQLRTRYDKHAVLPGVDRNNPYI